MDDTAVFLGLFYILSAVITYTGASSCTEDYEALCRRKASEGRLSHLRGGGTCMPNTYVHYTHACVVNNYEQDIDQCCCVYRNRVMCCRYHDFWDNFRCDESTDVISHLRHPSGPGAPSGKMSETSSKTGGLPLQVLLPAVLVPVVLLILGGICFIVLYHSHRKNGATTYHKNDRPTVKQSEVTSTNVSPEQRELLQNDSDAQNHRHSPVLVPSAPPIEENETFVSPRLPPYVADSKNPSFVPTNQNTDHPGHVCSSTCAPPTYAESLQHKVCQS